MDNSNTNKTKPDNSAQKKLVEESNDNKIDQDFKGFPAGLVKENIINPKTENEKKTAGIDHTDGEKMNQEEIEAARSDGSAGAFGATEEVKE